MHASCCASVLHAKVELIRIPLLCFPLQGFQGLLLSVKVICSGFVVFVSLKQAKPFPVDPAYLYYWCGTGRVLICSFYTSEWAGDRELTAWVFLCESCASQHCVAKTYLAVYHFNQMRLWHQNVLQYVQLVLHLYQRAPNDLV